MTTRTRKYNPVTLDEVAPGLVATMDVWMFPTTPGVRLSWEHVGQKPRPYLCLAVRGDLSWWTPLTSRPLSESGYQRMRILPAWTLGGRKGFHVRACYLHDSRDIAVIPTGAVVKLTHTELDCGERARLTAEGLAACLRQIEADKDKRRRPVADLPSAEEASR